MGVLFYFFTSRDNGCPFFYVSFFSREIMGVLISYFMVV